MGKGRRRHRDAPHVQPMDVDGVRTVAILTVLWAVAFVVLAFNREQLEDAGTGWLLWTCLAGVGLGLLGIEYTRKRREAIALSLLEEEAEDEPEPAEPAPEPDSLPTRPIDPAAPSIPDPHTRTDPIPFPPEVQAPETRRLPLRDPVTDPGTFPGGRSSPYGPPTDPGPPVSGLGAVEPPTPRNQPASEDTSRAPRPPLPSGAPHFPSDTDESRPPGGRRRRQSAGPAKPGRVDVGDVSDFAARIDPATPDSGPGPRTTDFEISPMWSELLDPAADARSASADRADSDEPLLDTTLGGRRARNYDMNQDIDEITEGGGGVYRGKRARRRPDSA